MRRAASHLRRREPLYVYKYGCNIDPRDIIRNMLNGVDISLIDPNLFSSLLPFIQSFIDTYTAKQDNRTLAKLHFYIEYIDKQSMRDEINALLIHERPPPPIKPPPISEAQVEKEVSEILESEKVREYPEDVMTYVIAGMRKRKAELIKQGNYIEAQKAEHFSKSLLSCEQLGRVESMQAAQAEELSGKLKQVEDGIEKVKGKWEFLYDRLKRCSQEEFLSMNEEHTKELEQIRSKKSMPPPPAFRKYSNGLLHLRRREKAMLELRKFREAAEVKSLADKMQADEDQENFKKWNQEIDTQIAYVNSKFEKQLRARRAYWKREQTVLVEKANKEFAQTIKSKEHIENHLQGTESSLEVSKVIKKAAEDLPAIVLKEGVAEQRSPRVFRQRAILNAKIYTKTQIRSPKGSPKQP